MMNINKLVLKGTGKISLHERFTQLSKFQVPAVKVGVSDEWDNDYVRGSGAGGVTRAGVGRYGRGATRGLSPEQPPHVTRVRIYWVLFHLGYWDESSLKSNQN